MFIERIQVEEGFLNGLDVKFTSGLNVIIGARGTGKTSLIELIRFCLNVESSEEQHKISREHSLSILGSGQVTVTLNYNDQKVVVTRTVGDNLPRATGEYDSPLIFSQTEIETIGLESNGRMRLIDSFLSDELPTSAVEEQAISEVNSLTAEIESIQRDIEELDKDLSMLPLLNEELKNLTKLELNVSESSLELKNKTSALQSLSEQISKFSVEEVQGDHVQNNLAVWYNLIKAANEFSFEKDTIGNYNISMVQKIDSAKTQLSYALENVRFVWAFYDEKTKNINSERIATEGIARNLRQEVESIQAGSGTIMRRIQEVKQSQAKLLSLKDFSNIKKAFLENLFSKRNVVLDRLDLIRLNLHKSRMAVVKELNKLLKPMIKIDLIRNGQNRAFYSVINDMLKGTGLRNSDVAKTLSEQISPRALLEAIDNFDFNLISEIAQISKDRATRILAQFKNSFLGTMGTLYLDDDVSLQLLDGMDYKDLSTLSTGQRCTVVLPIVLAHINKTLIVDQPEDHIDNAFITNTLIKSILNRSSKGQIIFTTHNPNIPVLGNADNVIHLGSDGKHGYIENAGKLNNLNIVQAISTVMEGGEEAFARRSSFYHQFLNE